MNDDPTGTPQGRAGTRKIVIAVGVGAVGLVAGGLLAGTLSSASAESSSGVRAGYGYGGPGGARGDDHGGPGAGDPTKPQRSDEKLLTGTTRTKVTAAVKKKYPTATIQRVETDSDGVYEAHVLLDGTPTIVQVGKDFTVTGTQTGGPGGAAGRGPGGPGGHGPGDGDGPAGSPEQAPPSQDS